MIKAIFFDIDGTLLDHDTHLMPSSTFEALKKFELIWKGENDGARINKILNFLGSFKWKRKRVIKTKCHPFKLIQIFLMLQKY